MRRLLLISFCALLIFSCFPATAILHPYDSTEMIFGYMTVIDEKGDVILQTGLEISPGDEYISENNMRFEITAVEGSLAKARYMQNESMAPCEPTAITVQASNTVQQPLIAIYHTHTDECYIPDDGKPTIPGKGSIMQVGNALTDRLNKLGYQTEHDKTLHDPHDANAYQRSRRTFMKLLTHQPAALFDIHRDSAPLDIYQHNTGGQELTKILLVVGRQNQNRNTTLDYAKSIKAAADAKTKGLIRGIFIARGNYNQDLNPRAMLVEIGTQYSTLAAAERSAALFADLIPSFLPPNAPAAPSKPPANASFNGARANPSTPDTEATSSAASPSYRNYALDILFILSALAIGIVAYLYLSTGSWQEAKHKLNQFRKYEFTNFLGWYYKKRKE